MLWITGARLAECLSKQAVASRLASWAALNPQKALATTHAGGRAAVLVPLFLGADDKARRCLSSAGIAARFA